MRNEFSSTLNNLSQRFDKKIEKKIDDRESRPSTASGYRNDIFNFGAFQMANNIRNDWARMGKRGGVVGP